MTNFLHGVETIENTSGTKPVKGVKSSVIGLVGTAPTHHVLAANRTKDTLVLCTSDVDDAKYFGPDVSGYTIPAALKDIRAQGAGIVIVVNTFDPTTNKTTVAAADLAIASGKIALTHADVINCTVKAAGGAGAALVEGTDYSIDKVKGIITVLAGGALAAAAQANVGYDYGNPAAVLAAGIVGTTSVGGVRSGMQAWLDAPTRFGFAPKILIAPGYSNSATVVAALGVLAQKTKLRAIYFFDAPVGTTVSTAISGRGPSGTINFNVGDTRGVPCFPFVDRGVSDLRPLSGYAAGVTAATDNDKGFWYSPSNKVIKGITGLEIPITAGINNPDAEANLLNGAGIVTVFNAFGTGFRLWGNRSSAFPGSSDIMTFISSQRVKDQIDESLEMAMLDYADQPITQVVIDAVLDAGNSYMRVLAGRGAVPKGSHIAFTPAKNPPSELALGHATFDVVYCPTPPLERTTFESFIDINLLKVG
jgi:phage tail sheath protein FI